MPGPDFPTGGIILGRQGIRAAYHLGRGSIVMRGKVEFETLRGEREAIIISEIPYQVNKAHLVERIGELVRDKKIEGISALRDESDRDGYRVVIELRRDAVPDVVLNQLYRFTALQSSFGANMVALDDGRPLVMNLKDLLDAVHRLPRGSDLPAHQISARQGARPRPRPGRPRHRGRQYRRGDQAHPRRQGRQRGARALMERDWPARDVATMVTLIDDPRHSVSPTGTTRLSAEQAKAILDLRLQRLTALGRDEIKAELDKLADEIADYLDILRSRARIQAIVKDELAAIRSEFATPRRTVIVDQEGEMEDEDLIQREDMVVTVSHAGYVKRVPLSTYRAQRRGGKGRAGMQTREEDFVTRLFVASTHTPVLFFSSRGQVYKEKVWRLPLAAPQARGKALINILPLEQGESITTIMPLPEDEIDLGQARRDVRHHRAARCGATSSRDFADVRRSGIIAMKLDEGDGIVDVQICTENDDVLLTTAAGQCIRFAVDDVRVFQGRTSMGVRGIKLADGDKLISLSILRHVEVSADERAAYLKRANAVRRGGNGEAEDERRDRRARRPSGAIELGEQRYVEHVGGRAVRADASRRTASASAPRPTNTASPAAAAKASSPWRSPNKNGRLVASFPVEETDQIMLVTDGGQLIRCPVDGIRIAGRSTQGVIVFSTAEGEHVVSVERLTEEGGEENGGE